MNLPLSNLSKSEPACAGQRGGAAVYFAISLVALVSSLAMVLDIGRLYNAQRSLQRAANIAALDAARMANGCTGHIDDEAAQGLAEAEVLNSLRRNQSLTGVDSTVTLGLLERDDNFRFFTAVDAGSASDRTAVQVSLQRPSPTRLLPLTAGQPLRATAAADSRPQVSFMVGSGLASLSGGVANDILGGLVGGNIGLNALHYQALAGTNVQLGALAAAAGVGTVDDFLTTDTGLGGGGGALDDLVDAVASGSASCADIDPDCSLAIQALQTLSDAAVGAGNVIPGATISETTGLDGIGESAVINVGNFVLGLAQSANGTNFIDLPIGLAIPGVGGVDARIAITEVPQTAVARSGDRSQVASTSQGQVELMLNLANVDLGVATIDLNVPLAIQLAKATANLDELQCARAGQNLHTVGLDATTSIATIGIGTFGASIDSPAPTISEATIASISVLGLPPINVRASALVDLGDPQDEGLDFVGPPFPSDPQVVGTDLGTAIDSAIGSLLANLDIQIDAPVVGFLLQPILDSVLATLEPTIRTTLGSTLPGLSTALIEPVLTTLGVSVGTAEVTVLSMTPVNNNLREAPDIDEPMSLQAFLFTH